MKSMHYGKPRAGTSGGGGGKKSRGGMGGNKSAASAGVAGSTGSTGTFSGNGVKAMAHAKRESNPTGKRTRPLG